MRPAANAGHPASAGSQPRNPEVPNDPGSVHLVGDDEGPTAPAVLRGAPNAPLDYDVPLTGRPMRPVGGQHAHQPSFEVVYELNARFLFGYCLWMVRDPALAEDVAADTFAAAYAAYDRHRPDPASVRAWLCAIARREVSHHVRRAERWRLAHLRLRREPLAAPDPATVASIRGDLDDALAAARRLPDRDRALLALRLGAQLTFAEIGEELGMEETSARVATHRALRRIKRALEYP